MRGKTGSPLIVLSANSAWNIVNFRSPLIDDFVARGYRVVALTPAGPHEEKLLQRGIPLVSLQIDNKGQSPLRDFGLIRQYRRELRSLAPDALLSFTIKPNIYGSIAAASLGISVINNVSGLGTAFIAGGWLEKFVGLLYRTALRRSSTVFFQNRDDQALFLDRGLVRSDQAQLLNGSGVDLEAFTPWPSAKENGLCFLLVGRLLWDKGVSEFVDAARIVQKTLPHARFQLLGEIGADNRTAVPREMVEGWVGEGLIEYLGHLDDVRPSLAASDCVVLPSYREGLPRSLIEAASMGRPSIATDVPGCRAAIDDGVTGYLCEPRSGAALAEAMLRFAALDEDTRRKMGTEARGKAVREFDQKTVVAAYISALARAGVRLPPERTRVS